MIPDLARTLRLERLPALGELWQARSRRAFDVYESALREPAARLQALRSAPEQVGLERWIEKHDPERLRRALQKGQGVATGDVRVGDAPFSQHPRELACHHRVLVDELDVSRSSRECLEAQCAAACEQIQASGPDDVCAEPVEERLPYPIGRRADLGPRGETQPPAAPGAADDAQQPSLRAARGHGGSALSSRGLLVALHRYNTA